MAEAVCEIAIPFLNEKEKVNILQKMRMNSSYDFSIVSPKSIEIRGVIQPVSRRIWLVIAYILQNGPSDLTKIDEILDEEIDNNALNYLRKTINRLLKKGGSKYQFSTAKAKAFFI